MILPFRTPDEIDAIEASAVCGQPWSFSHAAR